MYVLFGQPLVAVIQRSMTTDRRSAARLLRGKLTRAINRLATSSSGDGHDASPHHESISTDNHYHSDLHGYLRSEASTATNLAKITGPSTLITIITQIFTDT